MWGGAGRAIIICVIDNLVKGASGQALQNMNLIMGLPEETGLLQQVWLQLGAYFSYCSS